MPNWKDLLDEVRAAGSTYDSVRRKYLARLHKKTKRNIIVYYSGWLQKIDLLRRGMSGFDLNDSDKNGFMAAIHGMDKSKGLDLILHTPGGSIAATESLVNYLRSIFGMNIRAIVPQLAMSAGTMVSLACKEIVMGKHSSLGPIDPQILGLPAHGILEEFSQAADDINRNPTTIPLWQPIIAKYNPTLVGECCKAIAWSNDIVKQWLISGMFDGDPDAIIKAENVVSELGDHAITKSHDRHISIEKVRALNIKVTALEDDNALQDAVLSVHHACIQTMSSTPAFKIIENHNGVAMVNTVSTP